MIDIDLTKPWAIVENRARQLLGIVQRAEVVGDTVRSDGSAFTTPGGTKVIKVAGPLLRYDTFALCGDPPMSYDALHELMDAGLKDPRVQNFLLLIDSPGGEVSGLAELSDYISEADKTKPVYAHIQGTGASAAYWLACAARKITASRVSYTGSIGCIAIAYDERRALESMGVDEIVFVSSVSPGKFADPRTDEGRAQIQNHVDEVGQIFVDWVSARRSLPTEDIIKSFGGGDVLLSGEALRVRMIDGVSNLRDVISAIESGTQDIGGSQMLGVSTTAKDEIDETETEEEPVEEEAKKAEEVDPEEKPEEAAKKAEEEEKKEDEKMDDATAAFARSHPKAFSKVLEIGAVRERARIREIAELSERHPNKALVKKALFETPMSAGDYAVAVLRDGQRAAKSALENLNADAAFVPALQASHKLTATQSLEQRALEHAKTLGGKR